MATATRMVGALAQHVVVGIDGHRLGLAERVDRELGRGADDFDALVFSGLPSVSILISTGMRKVSRSCEILPTDAEALLGAEHGVLELELGRAARFDPLDEEATQVLLETCLERPCGDPRWSTDFQACS